MADDSTLAPLSTWADTLQRHREWVRGCIVDPALAERYDVDAQTKVGVVVAVAAQLDLADTAAWQALGVALGDAMSLATGFPWMEITDRYGTDPCLVADVERRATVFPLTMLSKRAENGDRPDEELIRMMFHQAPARAAALGS